LVAFAFGSGLVRVIRAHTKPAHVASERVLEKCGFNRIGLVNDPEDGRVWRWERTEAGTAAADVPMKVTPPLPDAGAV
jgi:RimJ/RimL family protein N-acetyltransferase